MAAVRTRSRTRAELGRAGPAQAAAVAELLHHELSRLMELYRLKESFVLDVLDSRLLTVPFPSPQLDNEDKLLFLHSALLQCFSLLERAIDKEEEELGSGTVGEYEKLRTAVKHRLSLLLINIGNLLEAANTGSILPSDVQLNPPDSLFDLKVWVYRVFLEVDFWTKVAISILQALPPVITKERARATGARSMTSTRLR